jgi:ribosomal protein S6--L-glutamate ligase
MTAKVPIAPIIALGARLRGCTAVKTLGVRPNLNDYSDEERELIDGAGKIYYPSSFYAGLFNTIGKPIFPSYHTYHYAQDKILQTALFGLAGIRHPRTRVFYGKRQMERILDYFRFPFIAKVPRGSARGMGVFLIRSKQELSHYCRSHRPAYIQEYLPIKQDIRVIVIGRKVVHAFRRIAMEGEHRTNLAAGGEVDLSPVPEEALSFALETARRCRWDDVGMDICNYKGRYYILEGNMKYGTQGLLLAGIPYPQIICDLIQRGEI